MTATDTEAPATEHTYSADDLRRLAGITPRQLAHWAQTGRLPDHRPEDQRTSGRPFTFTQADLDVVRLVVHLLAVGFVLDRAFAIANALVTDDEYRTEFAEIFELTITCRDTAATDSTEETP